MARRRSLDSILAAIPTAVGRADWPEVLRLAEQALEQDPGNRSARGFVGVATRQLRNQTPPAPTAETRALPSSFVGGRYEVRRFLGEGARKRVYLAHDAVLDRDVAFALLKTEGLDSEAADRARREAQTMGRLGAHPNIVTVHDLGTEDGVQYVVMELMEGGDLAALLAGSGEHRIGVERAVSICRAACRGLAFAHRKGVVHRDIKPSNIWFAVDGTAKIGDFGLALAFDAARLTRENVILGTVTYLSPEQATGAPVSPRSDLYSLGVVLYEMLTGRPPFVGDDEVAIIGQHINTAPVAPSWHNPACPRQLEALILRLLSKDPALRPESAEEVQAALAGVDVAAEPQGAPGAEPGSRLLDSLAGGVFVGRQKEMGTLKAAFEECLSGRGRLVMLVGEPGIGKTRTAEELRTYAGLRGAQVLWGRSHEEKGAPAYWPWIQAIRSYVREHDLGKLRAELGSGSGVIAELVGEVKARLPDVPAPLALDDPKSERFRLFDALSSFLKNASRTQPLVVVLDDLHWADSSTLALLEFVARDIGDARLLILGTYRDVEVRRTHPLQSTLASLTRERLFERVTLRGLTRTDVARFIELAAGLKAPEGLADAVFSHTEGNPLFVTEVVRLLVQRGELARGGEEPRKHWSLGIPEGVREVIGRRLDGLDARCNQVLGTAAVVGRSFGVDLLARLFDDVSRDRLIELLEEALFARIIEELPDAVGTYQFTHALVQETLIEELTLTARVKLHARIAEALEALYGEKAGEHAAELVRHFAEAETVLGREKVARYSLLAGKQAMARFAWAEALEHFERGLAAKAGGMDDETAGLTVGKWFATAILGTLRGPDERPYRELSAVLEYYLAAGRVSDAISVVMQYNAEMVDPDGITHDLAERLIGLVEPGSLDEARLWQCHVWTYYGNDMDARYEEAVWRLEAAMEVARRERDPALEMRGLLARCGVEWGAGHLELVLETAAKALCLAKAAGDALWQVPCLGWCALMAVALGRTEAARQYTLAYFKASERVPWYRPAALDRIAVLEALVGEFDRAREHLDEYIALEDPYGGLWALGVRALLEAEAGDMEAAERFRQLGLQGTDRQLAGGDMYAIQGFLTSLPWLTRYTGRLSDLEIVEDLGLRFIDGRLTSRWFGRSQRRNLSQGSEGNLAVCSVLRRDRESAAQWLPIIESRPRRAYWISSYRLLALLAHAAGERDKARRYFEESLDFSRRAEYWLHYVWTCHDYAELLMESRSGKERARELLEEGLKIADRIGMKTAAAWIRRLQERLPEAPAAFPDGLTEREVEVLRLVAKGFTNNDVANLLHISGRTVATHLRSVYEKTGCANRAEASAYAIRRGVAGE